MKENIYLLCGDEDYLIDQRISQLVKRQGFSPENVEKIEGSLANLFLLIENISFTGLFTTQRFILVEAKTLFETSAKNKKTEQLDVFIEAMNNLDPSIILVFKLRGWPDKRKEFYSKLKKIAQIEEFTALNEWEKDKAISFVVGYARQKGKDISSASAGFMVDLMGTSFYGLASEIDKLNTYIGERDKIETADIKLQTAESDINVFLLSHQIGQKKNSAAFSVLNKLMRNNPEPFAILGLMASQIRTLLQIKLLSKNNSSAYNLAQILKANHFYVQKSLQQSQNFTKEGLIKGLRRIKQAGLNIKSGNDAKTELSLTLKEILN